MKKLSTLKNLPCIPCILWFSLLSLFSVPWSPAAETRTWTSADGTTLEAELISATSKSFPIELKTGEWHDIVTVHDGETLTAYLDGEEVAAFTSPGFAHPTKQMFAFAVPVRATVDNLKIWSLKAE